MADTDTTTKQRGQTAVVVRTVEEAFAAYKKLKEQKKVDPVKGSGFIEMEALAGQDAMMTIKYPALCFKAMGFTTDANIEAALKKIDIASKELFIPPVRARTDAAGVSNRLQGFRDGKIIGKRITFKLPEATQRANPRGKPQLFVSTRVLGHVPVLSMGILQAWINSAVSDQKKHIKWIYGPSMRVRYAVPTDAAGITAAIREMAKTVEVAPPAAA